MADFKLFLPDGSGIMGSVNDDGVLSFVVLVRRGAPIRGTEMFDLMMRAFGSTVKAIEGVWRQGFGEEKSVNLDRVNELVAEHIPLEQAVCRTWTATRAARWGYTNVSVVTAIREARGHYHKIDILLQKPETTT